MANYILTEVPAESTSYELTEVNPERPSLLDYGKDYLKRFGKGALATGAGVADLATGIAKFPLGVGIAGVDTALGERADIARDSAFEALEDTYPSLATQFPWLQDQPAYKAMMTPFEVLHTGVEKIGDTWAEAGRTASLAAGDDPDEENLKHQAGLVKQVADIATFAAFPKGIKLGQMAVEATVRGRPTPQLRAELGYEARTEPTMGRTPPRDMTSAGEPTLPRGLEIDVIGGRGDPQMGRAPQLRPETEPIMGRPEIRDPYGRREPGAETPEMAQVREALAQKEAKQRAEDQGRSNIYQDQMELPFAETPTYRGGAGGGILAQDRLRMSREGIPYDAEATARYGRGDFEGDLWGGPKVTPKPETRQRTMEALDWVAEKKQRFQIERATREGPVRERFPGLREKDPKKRILISDISENPQLLRDPNISRGMDFWGSMLEDLNLPTSKIQRSRTVKELNRKLETMADNINRTIDKTKREAAESQRLYAGDIRRSKASQAKTANQLKRIENQIKQYLNVRDQLQGRVEKIYGEPLTRQLHPENLKPYATSKKLRGPGSKQGGAVDPSVFIDELRKTSKNLAEFTDRLVGELGEGFRPIAPALYRGITEEKRTAVEPYVDKGKTETIPSSRGKDLRRYEIADTREATDFVAANIDYLKSMGRDADIGRNWTNFLVASNIGKLAKKHPAIKWIIDRTTKHEREYRVNRENAKFGSAFVSRRGIFGEKWNERVKSLDGALVGLEKLKVEQADQALRVWQDKYDGIKDPTLDALKADGLSDAQANSVMAAFNQLKTFANRYNEEAAKHGFEPIKLKPGYFPRMWVGDYRVKVFDTDGKLIWVQGVETKLQADHVRTKLKEKNPEWEVRADEAKTRYDMDDTSSFREALSLLEKDSPEYAVLNRAFQDILSHRGFQKQTLFREGMEGYLKGKDSIKALDMYFDRGYKFLANQKKKADFANLIKGLKEGKYDLSKETPNAYNYMGAFLDNSTGAIKNGLQMIDNALEEMGRKAGIGPSAPRNVLSWFNGTASAFWLTTPRFVVSQLAQPLYGLPQAVRMKVMGMTKESVTKLFLEAMLESYTKPSKQTIAGLNWAKEHGYLDSKLVDLMGIKFDPKWKTSADSFRLFSRYGIGKLEQESVRTPAFIFYDKVLRGEYPDQLTRWEMAGVLTEDYMVNYIPTHHPLIYGKGGIVGDAAKPLKQFSHAYVGQTLEYAAAIKQDKTLKPLATMLGVQLLIGGLKGMPGVATATGAILLYNKLMHDDVPTPEEMLASSGLPDEAVFGGLSGLTGLDMTGIMGYPQLDQFSTFPGLSFAGKAAKDVGTLSMNTLSGYGTTADGMRALKSTTPILAHGAIEDAYTREGEGPPNPANRMKPDIGPRTRGLFQENSLMKPSDLAARYLGGFSMRESREKMKVQTMKGKEIQRRENMRKMMDVMVDKVAEGQVIPEKVIRRWVDQGGNPEVLPNVLIQHAKDKAMTYAERYLGNVEGISGAQRAKRLQDFRLIIENTDKESDPWKQIEDLAGVVEALENR